MANREMISVSVPVSGNCSQCGQLVMHSISTSAPRGTTAVGSADGKCPIGGCSGWAHMTGSVSVS